MELSSAGGCYWLSSITQAKLPSFLEWVKAVLCFSWIIKKISIFITQNSALYWISSPGQCMTLTARLKAVGFTERSENHVENKVKWLCSTWSLLLLNKFENSIALGSERSLHWGLNNLWLKWIQQILLSRKDKKKVNLIKKKTGMYTELNDGS